MSPISSASGMNSSGGIGPRAGWSQRISASAPTHRAGLHVDDRLVRDPQLAALERPAEVGLRLHPGNGRVIELAS